MPTIRIHRIGERSTVYYKARRFVFESHENVTPEAIEEAVGRLPKRPPLALERKFLLSVTVGTETQVNAIASLFTWAFPKRFFAWFWTILAINVALSAWVIAGAPPIRHAAEAIPAGSLTLWLLGLMLAIMLFHEIGHASACRALGLRADAFGIGIYFIFPAMFTKLSLASELPSRGRVIVYSAGVHFQSIAAVIIFLCALAFPSRLWSALMASNLIAIAANLLPVMKFDGHKLARELLAPLRGTRLMARIVIGLVAVNALFLVLLVIIASLNILSAVTAAIDGRFSLMSAVFGVLGVIGLVFLIRAAPFWIRRPIG